MSAQKMNIKLVLASQKRARSNSHRPELDQAEIDRYAQLTRERIEEESTAGEGSPDADVEALRAAAAARSEELTRLQLQLAKAERDVEMAPTEASSVRRRDKLSKEVRGAERRALKAASAAEEARQWEEVMKRMDERDGGAPSQASTSALANDYVDPFQAELDQLIALVKASPNGEVVYDDDPQEADGTDDDDEGASLEDVDSSDSSSSPDVVVP